MKKKHEISLTKEDFSFVCPLKTDDMKVIDGGHFCDSCEKKVHNVNGFSTQKYYALLKNNKDLCISFKKMATVSLVLSLSACSTPKPQQIVGKIVPQKALLCENKEILETNTSLRKEMNISNNLKPYKVKKQDIYIDRIEIPTAGLPVEREEPKKDTRLDSLND